MTTVIALHCSGSSGSQWKLLSEKMSPAFRVIAPDLIGCDSTGHWTGERPFTLTHEAAPVIKLIDAADQPVHLVGHSYGGCVAMRAALDRPDKIASLAIYEPVAFHVLREAGAEGRKMLAGIAALCADLQRALDNGELPAAAERFTDYWNSKGAFAAAPEKIRAAMTRYIPKVTLDFEAAVGEPTPLSAYGNFDFPVLLMRGERGPKTTRLIIEQLARAMRTDVKTVDNAGHMGPVTHPETVVLMVASNIAAVAPAQRPMPKALQPVA